MEATKEGEPLQREPKWQPKKFWSGHKVLPQARVKILATLSPGVWHFRIWRDESVAKFWWEEVVARGTPTQDFEYTFEEGDRTLKALKYKLEVYRGRDDEGSARVHIQLWQGPATLVGGCILEIKKRGAFIVLEGIDKAGKSTQAKMLVEKLVTLGKPAKYVAFPDRTTSVGKMIDNYLKDPSIQVEEHTLHLLFSANRWETKDELLRILKSGVHVVADRYAYSGVAYTHAKGVAGMDWCKGADKGLPEPDVVLFLDLKAQEAAQRGAYGDERYDKLDFQTKVEKAFATLHEQSMAGQKEGWLCLDATQPTDKLHSAIWTELQERLDPVGPVQETLWQ